MRYTTTVIAGKGRGAKMGTPTLNLAVPKNFLYKPGIYAGKIYTNDTAHIAAIHFGPIPTFNETTPVLEAALIDGVLKSRPKSVGIEIIHYMRDIETFKNSKDLAQAIQSDIALAKKLLA